MFPTICTIGPITIYSYGLMLAIAVMACAFFLRKDAKRVGVNPDTIVDFVFWVVFGGIAGARVFFILNNIPYFINNPADIFMLQKGGLSWQGGLILGTLIGLGFIKKKQLAPLITLDLIAPYLALGQAIGRLGCFLNGCCYGKEISWGVYFPVHGAHLHPTQIYSSLGLFAIFFFLKQYHLKKSYAGQIFVLYLLLASSFRFLIEFFRDDLHASFFGLSIYQCFCLIFIGIALYVNTRFKGRTRT